MIERFSDPGPASDGVAKSAESMTSEDSSKRPSEEGVATGRLSPRVPPDAAPDYMDVLVGTVAGMRRDGATMTAAAVSMRMRRADPKFTPQVAGFRTFSDFLAAAERDGRVKLTPIDAEGNGDILVRLPGDASFVPTSASSVRRWVPQAVWRAVFAGEPAFLDRSSGQLVESALVPSSDSLVELPTASPSLLQRWVQAFASTQPDPALSSLDANSSASLREQLESYAPRVRRSWFRFLRHEVVKLLEEWASDNKVPLEYVVSTRAPESGNAAVRNWNTNPIHPGREARREQQVPVLDQATSLEEIRRLVIRAISSMSRSELLRLPIPLEHLLR